MAIDIFYTLKIDGKRNKELEYEALKELQVAQLRNEEAELE